MTTDTKNLFEALGHMRQAHLLILAESEAHPVSYALSDAYTLLADAMSQLRGEIKTRQPERPIFEKGAA